MPAIELDYSNRDYLSIREFLVSTAKGLMPDWVTVGEPADMGTLLLELYAYSADVMNYYIDRVAAEPFLASAQRRLSVLSIADMLGYRPIAQQAAGVVLTLTIDTGAAPVDIPSGTLVHTTALREEDSIFFETIENVSLPTPIDGFLTVDVGANEGRTITDEFIAISNGAPLQAYVLVNAGVIQRSISVTVIESDGAIVDWSFVDRLTDAGRDASVYTTFVDDQKFFHVVFGDNTAGRIPPVGSRIFVTYRYGDGATGNVAANTITEFEDPMLGVSVTNALPAIGGADDESIESMRYSIPRAVKMRDRAVTIQDFADLALQVPGVAKSAAEGLYYTQVTVRIASAAGVAADAALKDRVDGYLTARSLVGTSVVIADPIWVNVQLTMLVHVQPQYGQEHTRASVDEAIKALFDFSNVGFNTLVSIGEVYRTAMNIAGVDYIDLTVLRLTGGATPVVDIVTDAKTIPQLTDANRTITAIGGLT